MILAPEGPHLLDSSAVIILMRQAMVVAPGARLPFATMGELLTGIERSSNPGQEVARIRATIGAASVVYPTSRTVRMYAQVSAELKRAGQPIPINDLWNAALALEWNVPLLARDAHFTKVRGLQLISIR